MQKPARLILPVLMLAGLAGCHTDPFSMKPEVRGVQIPDRSAEPSTEAEKDVETDGESQD